MKLNNDGYLSLHAVIPILLIVFAIGGIGAYVISKSSAAKPGATSVNCNISSSTSFTYCARLMYGDGQGKISLVTEGKGRSSITAQEFAQGSAGRLVNNTYDSTIYSALNKWNADNVGKMARMCVNVKSIGTSSTLAFGTNNLSVIGQDGKEYNAPTTFSTVYTSPDYQKVCSEPYKLSTSTLPNGNVTMTLSMYVKDAYTALPPSASSGPLRLSSASYEIVP